MSIKNNETLSSLISHARLYGEITRIMVMKAGGELPGHILASGGGAIAACDWVEENSDGNLEMYGEYTLHLQADQEWEAREILGIY